MSTTTTTNGSKRNTVIYWVATALLLLPTAGSGVLELFTGGPEATAKTIVALGYPLYLLRILGLAKVLGAVAIVSNKSARLKEWAYAGFTFELVGAAASHVLAGDAVHAPTPLIFLAFALTSYTLWNKRPVIRESP